MDHQLIRATTRRTVIIIVPLDDMFYRGRNRITDLLCKLGVENDPLLTAPSCKIIRSVSKPGKSKIEFPTQVSLFQRKLNSWGLGRAAPTSNCASLTGRPKLKRFRRASG